MQLFLAWFFFPHVSQESNLLGLTKGTDDATELALTCGSVITVSRLDMTLAPPMVDPEYHTSSIDP
jgi:hypothetical protein